MGANKLLCSGEGAMGANKLLGSGEGAKMSIRHETARAPPQTPALESGQQNGDKFLGLRSARTAANKARGCRTRHEKHQGSWVSSALSMAAPAESYSSNASAV